MSRRSRSFRAVLADASGGEHPPADEPPPRAQEFASALRARFRMRDVDVHRLAPLLAHATHERLERVLLFELEDGSTVVDTDCQNRRLATDCFRVAAAQQGLRVTRTIDGVRLRAELRQEAA